MIGRCLKCDVHADRYGDSEHSETNLARRLLCQRNATDENVSSHTPNERRGETHDENSKEIELPSYRFGRTDQRERDQSNCVQADKEIVKIDE